MVDIELVCGHIGRTEYRKKDQRNSKSYCDLDVDCKALVQIQIGLCGHTQNVKCNKKHAKVECRKKCVYLYPKCGHERYFECCQHPEIQKLQIKVKPALRRNTYRTGRKYNHGKMEVDCKIPLCERRIDKQRACSHRIGITCSSSKNAVCDQKCDHTMVCGHSCTNTCKLCRESVTHKECMKKCDKRLFCGHYCDSQNV
ncbi:unnamed protein product [Mytilus coruscus]|uniref:NFX1-type zinc finger-containing protein 1 n=1 Tax=Mytilus coruscus TaxID=42192 RepID=A0A6J8ERW5_MYTCO|nr:unnamed protein product [Mytilus coruscus]